MALCTWNGQMRLDGLMPASTVEMIPNYLPSRKDWLTNEKVKEASAIHLPCTKTTSTREMQMYFIHNEPSRRDQSDVPPHLGLTAGRHGLTMPVQSRQIHEDFRQEPAVIHVQRSGYYGHSFRIGSTSVFLMAGIDSDVVKKMGGRIPMLLEKPKRHTRNTR